MLIRKLRLQKGWSREQLAELSGLSVRTIQRVERGYPPSLETRNALVSVFEIDLSQLELEQRTMSDTPDNKALKEDEARALEYVQGLKAFYQHPGRSASLSKIPRPPFNNALSNQAVAR